MQNFCTHLDGVLHNEAMVWFQCALVCILQMLLERLRDLCIVVDVLEEGANELQTSFQPKQRIGGKIINIHIKHYHILQILIPKYIRSIDLGQFLLSKSSRLDSILSYQSDRQTYVYIAVHIADDGRE